MSYPRRQIWWTEVGGRGGGGDGWRRGNPKVTSRGRMEEVTGHHHPLSSPTAHLTKVKGGGGGGPSIPPDDDEGDIGDPGGDPLSSSSLNIRIRMINLSEMDPLTRMAVADEEQGLGHPFSSGGGGSGRPAKDTFEPWAFRKSAILSRFTTQEKLSITTSIYPSGEGGGGGSGIGGGTGGGGGEVRVGVSEKVLHRLEQLDSDSGGSKQFFGGLSQEEYTNKINQLHGQLTEAWQSDLRVNALKISIQCCKLLGDTSVISFYPSKFVIITDILDKFGLMVYTRLKGKQSEVLSAEVAKETCKNWFFKVGSIRELLPRLCIELAILKSYSFINPKPEYSRILIRLLNSMWGIGDPVVAIYLRCYLCRVGMDLVPDERELFMKCFQDLLLLHDQVLDNFRTNPQLMEAKTSMETYMIVLSPAIDWILQCLVHRGEHLHYTLQLVSNVPPFWKSVLLSSVLATFPPSFVAEEASSILEVILSLDTNLAEILRNLGLCLIVVPPGGADSKDIWPRVWSLIRKIQSREAYLDVAVVWMEFVVKNFGPDVVNSFLEDIMNHVSLRNVEQYSGKLANVVEKLLAYSTDITTLLRMNKFVKMVSLLSVESAKGVVSAFIAKHSLITQRQLGDNILISTVMHLASMLHDSVDALTPEDEVKQIGGLINGFILRVGYGRDYEKQLQFYDEARGAFTNIDSVLVQLVQCVCRLGMEVGGVVGGHHTKRTRGFLSACVAYAFITIPSLDNAFTQLQLYLLTAQVAYGNQCVSQGDACLKAAINSLNENRTEFDCGEPLLIEYICNLLSTLLAVPDHPKETMLYLLRALMSITWISSSTLIQLKFLSLLGAFAQPQYPYSFNLVETNCELYGGAPAFLQEIDSLGDGILGDLLAQVTLLGEGGQTRVRGALSFHIFWGILDWGDIGRMERVALDCWELAAAGIEPKLLERSLEAVRERGKKKQQFLILASKMTT